MNDGTLGWIFTATKDLTVNKLGLWDDNQDGLGESHQVAIWNAAGTLLVQATVGSGDLENKFQYVPVPDTTLAAGQTYVIGAFFRANGPDNRLTQATDFTTDPGITYIGEAGVLSPALALPQLGSTVYGYGIFGPNFQFTTAPDLAATSLSWDTAQDGVDFGYSVSGGDLTQDTKAALYWASGPTFDTVIGSSVYDTTIEHPVGDYGPFYIPNSVLGTPPVGAKYLLEVVDPDNTIAESDETNNVQAIPLTDIAMVSAKLDSPTSVSFQYATTGDPGPFTVGLYRSADGKSYDPANPVATQVVTPGPTNPQTPGVVSLSTPLAADPDKPYLVVVADPGNVIAESDETNNVQAIELKPDLAATSVAWDTTQGGVDYGYTISIADLFQATTVDLDWASGTTANTVIGNPIVTTATQTAQGTYQLYASPSQLGAPPSGATYLLVVADPHNLVSPADPGKVTSWRSDLSGKTWLLVEGVSQQPNVGTYPYSTLVSDLDLSFRGEVESFIAALQSAHARIPGHKPTRVTINIISTLRSKERAYLMHYAWLIAKGSISPTAVPQAYGIDIRWDYGDDAVSQQAAQQMVEFFGINGLGTAPALHSNHESGLAIDMAIAWKGRLMVTDGNGVKRTISERPHDSTNGKLIEIGRTFGVIHFRPAAKDRNHWSINGR